MEIILSNIKKGDLNMNDLISNNKNLQVSEWKKRIQDSSSLHLLQERLDLAEKNQENRFEDFSDSVVFIPEGTSGSAA